MNKRVIGTLVLAVLLAASAYAQTTDFIELVKNGTPQSIQTAIDQGADIEAQDDKWGRTPLMSAVVFNQNLEAIRVLLKAGANVNRKDYYGETALIDAAGATLDPGTSPKPEMISLLLKAGADANVKGLQGYTALITAVWRPGAREVVSQLLSET